MNEDINNETDIIYKFIMIGDSNSRKTSIFKKLFYDQYCNKNVSTLGLDYKTLNYEIEIEENGKNIKKNTKIKLFDTAGQDRFRSLTKSYINNSNGIILVYDINERKSFDGVIEWVKSIEEEYRHDQIKACLFLIGTRNDSDEEEGEKDRKVQTNEAERLAEKYGIVWGGECNVNIYTKNQLDEILIKFAQIVYYKYGNEKKNTDNVTLDKINNREKKKSCKS